MSDARIMLERFNKVRFIADILLVILFFTLTFFGLALLVPADHLIGMLVQSAATFVTFIFTFGCLRAAEHLTGLMKLKLEEAVEEAKTDEERAAPVAVVKKSVSAMPPSSPTISNTVIKTTKVVLKSPSAAAAAASKRGRPKKEG